MPDYPEQEYLVSQNSRVIFPRQMGLWSVPLIGVGNHRQSTEQLAPHQHAGILEIVYLHRGRQLYCAQGKEYRLYGGNLFIVPPNIIHSTGGEPEEKSSFVWIHIDLSRRKNFMGLSEPMSEEIWEAFSRMPLTVAPGSPRMAFFLEEAVQAGLLRHPLRRSKIQLMALNFLMEALRCVEEKNERRLTADILSALELMDAACPETVPIQNLARSAGLSESRFRQKFKEQVGIPVLEYQCRRRIELAKRLIRETDASFAQIAEQLEFQSPAYFTRIFKKYVYETPSDYRSKIKKSGSTK